MVDVRNYGNIIRRPQRVNSMDYCYSYNDRYIAYYYDNSENGIPGI